MARVTLHSRAVKKLKLRYGTPRYLYKHLATDVEMCDPDSVKAHIEDYRDETSKKIDVAPFYMFLKTVRPFDQSIKVFVEFLRAMGSDYDGYQGLISDLYAHKGDILESL